MFRGLKVKFAQELGAIGVLIYSDPTDDGGVDFLMDMRHILMGLLVILPLFSVVLFNFFRMHLVTQLLLDTPVTKILKERILAMLFPAFLLCPSLTRTHYPF